MWNKRIRTREKVGKVDQLVIWTLVNQIIGVLSVFLKIFSGLKETFIKRYKVERTNKAEIRPEEQSQKTESCRES